MTTEELLWNAKFEEKEEKVDDYSYTEEKDNEIYYERKENEKERLQ